MSSTNEKFRREMFNLADQAQQKDFVPDAFYNEAGDCIEYLVKPDPYYRERINNRVTVYYSHIDNEVIGVQIKGIAQLKTEILNKIPGFAIEIRDGKVRLAVLIQASFWRSQLPKESNIQVEVYEKLRQYAEKFNTEAEFCLA